MYLQKNTNYYLGIAVFLNNRINLKFQITYNSLTEHLHAASIIVSVFYGLRAQKYCSMDVQIIFYKSKVEHARFN